MKPKTAQAPINKPLRKTITSLCLGVLLFSGCAVWNRPISDAEARRIQVEAELHYRAAMEKTPGPWTKSYWIYRYQCGE